MGVSPGQKKVAVIARTIKQGYNVSPLFNKIGHLH